MQDMTAAPQVEARASALRFSRPGSAHPAVTLFGALLAVAGVVGCSAEDSSRGLLVVSPDPEAENPDPLDSQALEAIRGTEGVDRADPWFQAFLEMPQDQWPDAETNPGGIAATPLISGRTPEVVSGSIPDGGL